MPSGECEINQAVVRINRGEPAYQRGEFDTEKRVDQHARGRWWVPGDEEHDAEGTAHMPAEGLTSLDLYADPWLDVSNVEASRELRTIYGKTPGDAPMSLHAVRFVGGEEEPFVGRAYVRYVAERLILGVHADSEEQVSISALSVSYRGLREWLLNGPPGTSTPLHQVFPVPESDDNDGPDDSDEADPDDGPEMGGEPDAGTDADDNDLPRARVDEWEMQTSVDVCGVELIASAGSGKRGSATRFRTVYDTTAILRLKAEELLTLAEWRRTWIEPLRDLVLFGTREQTVILYTRWRDPDLPRTQCGVYLPPDTRIGPPDHAEYHQRDLLPSGIWGQDGFGTLIERWRELYLSLGSVATNLFEVLNIVDMPPLTRLLRLTACAEGYHRVKHNKRPFTRKEHKAMVKAMLAALPDAAARAQYRGPLQHADAQSQSVRLRWLIDRAAEVDDRLEGRADEITRQLVNWRNDQTHLDTARPAPPRDELLLLNAVLTYVLEANILLDLGLDTGEVAYCLAHGHAWDNPVPAWLEDHPASGSDPHPEQ